MIALIAILAMGALVWSAVLIGGRLPASARIPLAATVMVGLAGYLLVGRPGLPGAPVPEPVDTGFGEALTDPRHGMSDRFGEASQWLGMSDGLMRTGHSEMAAELLQQGLRRHPRNVDLWVGFGNALVAHAGGVMTPAAAMAFDRAADIDPTHPAPPFFAGLALAQGGDVEGARTVWSELLARSPANAPWRADLQQRLAQMPPPVTGAAALSPSAVAGAPAAGAQGN